MDEQEDYVYNGGNRTVLLQQLLNTKKYDNYKFLFLVRVWDGQGRL
jgi:hypothetical protein